MSRLKVQKKPSYSETLNKNKNVAIHLAQYKLSDIPNPSDDSDFEDTSYETDILYEKARKIKLRNESEEQLKINKQRETNAKLYFLKHKNMSSSIFNLRGINISYYNHLLISIIFSPSAFSYKFICAHRKFHISLVYKNSCWALKNFHVPNKIDILRLFSQYDITDDNLINTLFKIYDNLVKWTHDEINSRKEKYEKFLSHEDVELNSDDEKLFFSSEERKKRKAEVEKIWNRMLPPQ